MPDVTVDKGITLDLLDQQKPGTSVTSDMPVVETRPDVEVKKPAAAAPAQAQDTEEPAPSDQPGETPASDAPKKAQGVQKRLDELTRQREDEKRARLNSEQQLERTLKLLEKAMEGKPAQVEAKDDADPEPAEPDVAKYTDQNVYNTDYRRYLQNLAKWEGRSAAKQTLKEEREAAQKRAQEDGHRKVSETYQARVDKAREKYPDYDAKVYSESVPFTRPMTDAIVEMEHGTDVAYFLADNPQEFDRISKLSPRGQVMELGYLSAQFRSQKAAEPAAQKAPVSQAPKPIRPLGGGGGSPAPGSPQGGEESMDAYAARRSKELAKERVPGGVRR